MNTEEEHIEVNLEEPKEQDVEVIVEDGAPEQKAGQAPQAPEPDEAIQQLQRQLEEERSRRAEAEAIARKAAEQANSAYSEVEDTNIHLVNTAIDTVKRDNEILTTNYAEAMAVGDYDRAAKIQSTMATNAAKLMQLETGLQEMKNQPRRPVVPMPKQSSINVDQIIPNVTPRSATWLRANKSALNSEAEIREMFRAHERAIDLNIEPDSDAYFQFIEQRLGINSGAKEQDSPMSSAAKPARSAAPAAAPVNRESQSRPGTYRLTRAEAETAKMLGMTEAEYAKHKIALQKEGKLSS